MGMVVSVLTYIVFVIFVYVLAVQRHKKMLRLSEEAISSDRIPVNTKYKMPVSMTLFIAFIFALYNALVTAFSGTYGGDRLNYSKNFYGIRPSSSAGLNFVVNILTKFTSDVRILFYFATFACVIITLIAYRICSDAMPGALLFLLTTQYVLFSFAAIKQCFTNAFAALFLVFALRSKGIKDNILAIIFMFLACWFHPAGYMLILLYILLRIKKNKIVILVSFVLMFYGVFFFETILLKFAGAISSFVPVVSRKIFDYFGEMANSELEAAGPMSMLKGIPYYIITFIGWLKRSSLRSKIENYDNYLFLSGFMSFIYLASLYNSWVIRLSYLVMFPVSVFFVKLMRNLKIQNNYFLISLSVYGISALLTIRFLILMFYNYGGF